MADVKADLESLLAVGGIDKTIHEPARLMILSVLFVVDRADFVFLHNLTQLTRGNLSTHMSRLEEAGYIRVEKEFVDRRPLTTLVITEQGREALTSYRETMKRLLHELS